jgi:serine/threonine-protein kinase RsbT
MDGAQRLPIRTRADVEQVRRAARSLAASRGLDRGDAEAVALTVSELATNLLRYADGGHITLQPVHDRDRAGIEVTSQDVGPGIKDVYLALQDGYSTGGGLGNGLAGARRLMDQFQIDSNPNGTRIVATKWCKTH